VDGDTKGTKKEKSAKRRDEGEKDGSSGAFLVDATRECAGHGHTATLETSPCFVLGIPPFPFSRHARVEGREKLPTRLEEGDG